MRQEVKDLAVAIANEQLEGLDYMGVVEFADGAGEELSDEEFNLLYHAVTCARTTLDPVVSGKIERLQDTVRKLSNISGIDISELIDEGYLLEDDC